MYSNGSTIIQSALVAVKYDGSVHTLISSNVTMTAKLGLLNIHSSPYYCWKHFTDVMEAKAFFDELGGIDLSVHIPEDPTKMQRARYVSLVAESGVQHIDYCCFLYLTS